MIIQRFQQQVEKHPEKVAIKNGSVAVTYSRLHVFSNKIADKIRGIHKPGTGEKGNVALLIDDATQMIAAILGTLKSGNIYVPLSVDFPVNRMEYIIRHAQIRIFITDLKNKERVLQAVKNTDIHLIFIDNIETGDEVGESRDDGLDVDRSHYSDCDAYILYTSGSTGHPKGVRQTHQNIVHFAERYIETLGITAEDNLTLFSAFTHDAAVIDIYSTLLSGATLYPRNLKEEGVFSMLFQWLKKERITVWHSVPTVYRYFTAQLEERLNLPALRYVVFGGEAVRPNDIEKFCGFFPQDCRVYNLYGQTESTYNSGQFFSNQEGLLGDTLSITLGEAVRNTQLYLVDDEGNETDVMEVGEIIVVSDFVSPGYWKDETGSREQFAEDPEAGRIYFTGDLGRRLMNGQIEYTGRKDNQVKIRGYRVELGEIENTIAAYEGIIQAAVIAVEANSRDQFIACYFSSTEAIDIQQLKHYLDEHLLDYMVPTYFTRLEKLPVTSSGKIDRKALPKPELTSGTSYVAPRTDAEKKMAAIWSKILDTHEQFIGIDNGFFQLGGHSLSAVLLTAKIHDEFHVMIPLARVFEALTIRQLCRIIDDTAANGFQHIPPVEKREYYLASSAQKRMYIIQQMEPGTTTYNMPELIPLQEKPDMEILTKIFNSLLHRHESLRTSFFMMDGEPVQRVSEDLRFSIEELSVDSIQNLTESFIRPFDLSQSPLFRVGFFQPDPGKYFLIVDKHHIIFDALSYPILVKEFTALNDGISLAPLPIQYKDYAHWQRSEEWNRVIKKQEKYWLNRFKGDIPQLELSTDFPRPAVRSYEGALLYFQLEEELYRGLTNIAASQDTTLYTVILAVYFILLSRLTRQEDIVVGTDTAGRTYSGLEVIIGMFVNTLPLREQLTDSETFHIFLQQVRKNTLQALQNQDYPFEYMVEKLTVHHDAGRNPLFDVMYSFLSHNVPSASTPSPPIDAPLEIAANDTSYSTGNLRKSAKFDLSLNAVESKGNIDFSFEYCTRLFKTETVRRFSSFFKQIIRSLVRDSNLKLSDIEMISVEEKKHLLFEFNNTAQSIPRDKTFIQLFEDQVAKTPDNIAVIHHDLKITYRELSRRATFTAGVLKEKGLRVNDFAVIYLERSPYMLAGILGVFKAGGAYVPIDTAYPPQRAFFILQNSNSNFVLIDAKSKSIIQSAAELSEIVENKYLLDLEQLHTRNSLDSRDYSGDHFPITQNDDLVYMIYTSGTTGQPKGAMIHQLGMINHIHAKINDLSITAADIIAQTASSCFDISVWQFLTGLCVGATTIVIDKEDVLEPGRMMSFLQTEGITVLESVPSLMSVFLEMLENEPDKELKQLRWMLATGETLSLPLARRWFKHYPGIKMVNAYGPTEASDDITHHIIGEMPGKNLMSVPVGRPIQNMHIYILDKNLSLCPAGVRGEICTAGIGVGKGYWKDAEKTARAFVPNPYVDEIGNSAFATLYKTGDIGYINEDGDIECVGRTDHQVKIRGNRIELGEIEARILEFPGIRETVVVVREVKVENSTHMEGDKYLCAYIVSNKADTSNKETETDIVALRNSLREELPYYMVPSYFVPLEKMPVNTSGKINRKALPLPDFNDTLNYVPPVDEVEKEMVEIWAGILKVSPSSISTDENFFEIGGHSLSATQMAARIQKQLDVKVPLEEIFRTPTVRELSDYIKTLSCERYVSLQPAEEKEYYPLSSAQKRLFIVNQISPNSTVYNISTVVQFIGRLDVEKLEAAFFNLINRHESLRTSFHLLNGDPVKRIHPESQFKIQYHYLDNTHNVEEIIESFIRPFDLSLVPLMRVALIKRDADNHFLAVDIHHIISDGVSMNILITDWAKLYLDETLPPLKFQYRDYSQWQASPEHEESIKKQEVFWMDQLGGNSSFFKLPTDFADSYDPGAEGESLRFYIEKELVEGLKNIALEVGGTLYMVLLAAYNALLYTYSGSEDILVGSPVAGRPSEELHNILGMFVNMLPMRNFPTGQKTFKDFLVEVKNNTLQAFSNQDYQFDQLISKLGLERNTSSNPLIETVFTLQNAGWEEVDFTSPGKADLIIKPYQLEADKTKFPLTLDAIEGDGNLKVWFVYSTSLFKRSTIERMKINYIEIVEQVVKNVNVKLEDILVSQGFITAKPEYLQFDQGDFGF